MLKRVISLVVGVACLLSMTSAFAAMTYDSTRTEYHATGQIKVTSTVSGATGDTATYLVYDNDLASADAIAQGSQIVYVDQYKFVDGDNGKWTFSYVTDNADIGAKIQVGNGATNPNSAPANIPGITYPVTVTDGTNTWAENAYTDAAENSWYRIPYATSQSIIKKVTVGDTALTADQWFTAIDALWISDAVTLSKDGNEITVEVENAGISAKTISMAYFDGDEVTAETGHDAADAEEGYTGASVVAVGQVVGNIGKFGIILGESTTAIQDCLEAMNAEGSTFTGAEAYKADAINAAALPSLAKNSEGKFAIRVYDAGLTTGTVAAVYYLEGTEYKLSGNYSTLTIPSGE